MKRRDFSFALVACLATPALSKDKAEKQAFPSHGRVKMRLAGKERQAANFILLTPAGAMALPLNRQYPVANENRLSLLTPTVAKRYRKGVKVGSVLTDGRNILAKVDRPLELEGLEIADEEISYRIPSEPIRPTKAPSLNKFTGIIGTVMIQKDNDAFAQSILLKVKRDILVLDALQGL